MKKKKNIFRSAFYIRQVVSYMAYTISPEPKLRGMPVEN